MNLKPLRAATALLLAVITSAGIQAQTPSNKITEKVVPEVLSAQTIVAQPEKMVQEASSAASNSAEITVAEAPKPKPAETPIPEATLIAEETRQNEKAEKVLKLQKFLKKNNSPMTDNAQDFIDASEQYSLDWKLVPAIAGVESTFGKHLIDGTYNSYGWGGGTIRFESWRDGIFTVSKGLSEKYIQRGLTTPMLIQPVYCPPSQTWGNKVMYFMDQIEKTALSQEDK